MFTLGWCPRRILMFCIGLSIVSVSVGVLVRFWLEWRSRIRRRLLPLTRLLRRLLFVHLCIGLQSTTDLHLFVRLELDQPSATRQKPLEARFGAVQRFSERLLVGSDQLLQGQRMAAGCREDQSDAHLEFRIVALHRRRRQRAASTGRMGMGQKAAGGGIQKGGKAAAATAELVRGEFEIEWSEALQQIWRCVAIRTVRTCIAVRHRQYCRYGSAPVEQKPKQKQCFSLFP